MKSPYGIEAGDEDPKSKVIITDIILCLMALTGIVWFLSKIICF